MISDKVVMVMRCARHGKGILNSLALTISGRLYSVMKIAMALLIGGTSSDAGMGLIRGLRDCCGRR